MQAYHDVYNFTIHIHNGKMTEKKYWEVTVWGR